MNADRHAAILVACMLILGLSLGLLGVVVFSDSAAAQEEPSLLDQATTDTAGGVLAGIRGRIAASLAGLFDFGEPDTDATDACADLRDTVNSSSGDIESWLNNRTTASEDLNVLAVECTVDDTSETDYLVADVDNGSYVNGTMVDETDRMVDERCTLEDSAALNAADEAQTFVGTFAAPGADISEQTDARLKAQYAGKVSCTFFGDS